MKKLKRIAATLLALLTVASFAAFAGCNKSPATNSSVSESASDTSEGGDKNACTNARGHAYSADTGLCKHCNQAAVIPPLTNDEQFPLVEPCPHEGGGCNCTYPGAGKEYNRLQLQEGCYTLHLEKDPQTRKYETWLSFSVKRSGQYLLYSVDGANGVSLERYNASEQYTGTPIAPLKKEENFYSYLNCGDLYFNASWRATFRLSASKETSVKIRFVRIADPIWEPTSVRTKVYPTQINGKKAPEGEAGKTLKEVHYNLPYFYDETVGYYRLGSKETPGEIIYAAIDRAAPRLFGETTVGNGESVKFTNVLQGSGTALNVNDGFTEDGNYNVLCYTPFIMNWIDEDAIWDTSNRPSVDQNGTPSDEPTSTEPEGDPTKNSYENFCNSDGVYPVNQELFKFLTLYTKEHTPVDAAGIDEENLWLAACYIYDVEKTGTQENPLVLTEGAHTFTNKAFGMYYCTITTPGTYTITCLSGNAKLEYGNTNEALTTKEIVVTDPVVLIFRGVTNSVANEISILVQKTA